MTADGLTVDSGSASTTVATFSSDLSNTWLNFESGADSGVYLGSNNGQFKLLTNTTNRLAIDNNGDISFYEDTGTTAKFFWDASAESLAIGQSNNFSNALANDLQVGTTSGSHGITIVGQNTASANLFFADNNNNDRGKISYSHASDALSFTVASTERMRIDSSGNVGIGTANTGRRLTVDGSGLRVQDTSSADFYSTGQDALIVNNGTANLRLWNNGSERMRLDASGNLLVSKTASSLTTVGCQLQATGLVRATVDGADVLQLNRKTSDGAIASFYKSGATVGSIGTSNSRLHIGNGDVGLLIAGDLDNITPWNSTTGASRDAAVDLGNSGVRFKDLYLSGGAYLGGTAAANKLDDYEEGTFTPTLFGATTAGTPTYTNQSGNYTKIGNTVRVQLRVSVSAISGVAGSLRIGGLPFTSQGENIGSIMLEQANWPTGTTAPAAYNSSSTNLQVFYMQDDAGWTQATLADEAQGYIITIMYRTAA